MKLFRYLLICVCALCLPFYAGAWGAVGHKLVAKIAYSQLPKPVKDSLAFYLEQTTIEEASVWMDEIKADPANDSLKPFHYINIDKGQEYNPDSTHNIIGELNRVIYELKHRSDFSKDHTVVNLKILIHLMGDLHQPLHTGYASDRGGNDVQVFFSASSSNLHRVWDSNIVEDYVMFESTDWANTSNYSKEKLDSVKHIDIVGWMNESRSHLDAAYDFEAKEITKKYIKRNEPVVEQQLLFGGLRLAKLLRVIFHA